MIESVGLALERASPIVFLLGFHTGIYAFTWGLLLGRVFRMILVNLFYRASFHLPSWGHVRQAFYLVKEGTWLQVASGAAFVRDNLHVLLVGPLFGSNWVGYYGWGLQLSLIASQVFVQISARVSVPMFAQTATFERRWQNCLYQIRLLAMLTAPILIAVLLVLPGIDDHFFLGKWRPGISILPLLFLRMLPGLATTPLGALLMVERGGKRFATANVLWAALEVAGAALLLHLLGPTGLAWSYATVVWIGLAICLAFLGHNTARLTADVAWSLLQRPSLIIGSASLGALVLVFAAIGLNQGLHYQIPVAFAAAVLAAAYLSESYIRKWILALLRRREVA